MTRAHVQELEGVRYEGSSDFAGCLDLHRKIAQYCHYKVPRDT